MRLQKLLAAAGIASRRDAEELIAAGSVKVNGQVITTLGVQVQERHDRVDVNGRRVSRTFKTQTTACANKAGSAFSSSTRSSPEVFFSAV